MNEQDLVAVLAGVPEGASLHVEYVAGREPTEGRFGTFWDVPAASRDKVVSWHCEPATCGESGFPAGTLLHHG